MNNKELSDLINIYTDKICQGLPEWNYSGAEKNAEIQKQKKRFIEKMDTLKKSEVASVTEALRAMDLIVAGYVPDEHIQIRVNGEDGRAADLSKYANLKYKIPPKEKNNVIFSGEAFDQEKKFVFKTKGKQKYQANVLVATIRKRTRTVGVVAADSFLIQMGDEKTRNKADKVADYVLKQSQKWDDIIFDFRGNGGGDATLIKQIGERLSGKKLKYADKIEIIGNREEEDGPPDRYFQKPKDKTFSGNVYVLQDRGNSSAADGAIWMLRQMDNCQTIGENTYGAFAGGGVQKHKMKEGILLMGNTYRERTMPNGDKVKEGKGIPPDIRCDSKKAYAKALNLIENK